jgi:2-polyprenyl-3-methyl-5-hydroxy-6-metoxy-1,4-benzoquinol methylase
MALPQTDTLTLPYRKPEEFQDVDIARLRPGNAYAALLEKRTHPLKKLIEREGRVPKEMLHARPCPSCGRNDHRRRFEKDHFSIVACTNCDLVFVNPILDHEAYVEIYQSTEYTEIVEQLVLESHNYRRQRFGTERAEIVERFSGAAAGRLLEIGSSTGFFLVEARQRGWEVEGIELNPLLVQFARNQGLTIHDQPLEMLDLAPRAYSAVTLFDVIEHLPEPGNILRQCHDLMSDDGILYLYVPNYDSASRFLLGEQQAHFIWPTHHLTYFTPRTLKTFLERHGYEVIHWETQGLDIDDWLFQVRATEQTGVALVEEHRRILQFFINSAGYGKNLRMYARKLP